MIEFRKWRAEFNITYYLREAPTVGTGPYVADEMFSSKHRPEILLENEMETLNYNSLLSRF
jgi:hypothetical protein